MVSVALANFPKTEREFHARFGNEEACREYLISLRWPEGFVCPHCGCTKSWRRSNRDEWLCANKACFKETSLRAGTLFHRSNKPLTDWFLAMFHMVTSKQGISALELQRRLGFGSYRTTMRWLRELRRVMGTAVHSRAQLSGDVECDEMLIGGKKEGHGLRGWADPGKVVVIGAVERRGASCGRARLRLIPSNDGPSIKRFVADTITMNSIIYADAASVYRAMPGRLSVTATTTNTKGKSKKTRAGKRVVELHLPRIHRIFSLVKRVVIGCHQGRFSRSHIQGYLDEYCFRFDGRSNAGNLKMVRELAACTVKNKCVPYWQSSGRSSPTVPTKGVNQAWVRFAQRRGKL